ncbi:MAG: site-specific DNA-methyltransferase [Synechococcaceae cyanobacterium SM1_2_3]|nr:site-specific DNA-methyltransferase [Synechococcaceae cyanobacterium SM1_2_3]
MIPGKNSTANKLGLHDQQFHNWYRFVLSFPPHLVRQYIDRFGLQSRQTILDPFCGTGTTLVESKILGISSIGIEANPMAHFASMVKVDWSVNNHAGLIDHSSRVADYAEKLTQVESVTNLRILPAEADLLLLKDSISPLPLHKSLILLEAINHYYDQRYSHYQRLAFAKALVFSISNLHFGPEVGVCRLKKQDAPVVECWMKEVLSMAKDLRSVSENCPSTQVHHADARQLSTVLQPNSIDAVFTSPPYPNEKDYTRTTRLESVLLGFINNRNELRTLKQGLLRSNTRNVYKGDIDDQWVFHHQEIQAIANSIESRRIELNKTSGFEKLYGRVTKLYFGGMARHLAQLRPFLKSGAYLGYVVGDQASYFQVIIKTGEILADIAQALGYKVVALDLFRTRFATATKQQLREEVVILQWI